MRYAFLLEPLMIPILFPFGANPENCYVEIEGEQLHVKMGKLFDEKLDLRNIAHLAPDKWPFWWGLGHRIGFNHAMGVLGSTRNVVRLHFKEPAAIKALGAFSYQTHDFYLALQDPDGFIQDLQKKLTN